MRILWIGPSYSDWALGNKRSVNLAAVRWSRGLLSGLREYGAEIYVISHCPEQSWPNSKIFWQDADVKYFENVDKGVFIAYPNVKRIRDQYLACQYGRKTRELIRKYNVDVVLTYNCMHSWCIAAAKSAQKENVPTYHILLDGDDPQEDGWRKFNAQTQYATGIAFLSYWAYENFHRVGVKKLHMDGGADCFVGTVPTHTEVRDRSLVYTGALDKWRGLDFLQEVVKKLNRSDVAISLCGNFDVAKVSKVFANDKRVLVKGLLSVDALNNVCQNADAFLNVRNPDIRQNIVNFPSKVPQYLRYGRPVVTTWIQSFSPDYRGVLSVAKDNSVESFVAMINEVLSWSDQDRLKKYFEIKHWYENHKLWKVQAGRLLDFMKHPL